MAAITRTQLENAAADAATLEAVVNGTPDTIVTSRLGRFLPTLASITPVVIEGFVSILDYIPSSEHAALIAGISTYDCTSAFTQAISDNVKFIRVPPGTFPVTTRIELTSNNHIHLTAGASIGRFSSMSSETTPIFSLRSNGSRISGEGYTSKIFTENDHPDGVVHGGAWDMATPIGFDILYTGLSSIRVTGKGAKEDDPPNALIKFINPQLDGHVFYFSNIFDVWGELADIGIWLQGWANGIKTDFLHFQWLGVGSSYYAGIFIQGALDNSFGQMFFHYSDNVPALRIEDYDNTATTDGSLHVTSYSTFSGIVSEQGGSSATCVIANANCTAFANTFIFSDNTAAGNDLSNDVLDNNTFISAQTGSSFNLPLVGRKGVVSHRYGVQSRIGNSGTAAVSAVGLSNGVKLHFASSVTGTLASLLGNGTLVAADASSKTIVRFNPLVYSKSLISYLRAKLSIIYSGPGGGVGAGDVKIDFLIRKTDNSTGAMRLDVLSVEQHQAPNPVLIAGLKFLTGVSSGAGFGIAVVGGNFASLFRSMHVDLELTAIGFNTVGNLPNAQLASIVTEATACTANDVTDAIDLLTVANTVF